MLSYVCHIGCYEISILNCCKVSFYYGLYLFFLSRILNSSEMASWKSTKLLDEHPLSLALSLCGNLKLIIILGTSVPSALFLLPTIIPMATKKNYNYFSFNLTKPPKLERKNPTKERLGLTSCLGCSFNSSCVCRWNLSNSCLAFSSCRHINDVSS